MERHAFAMKVKDGQMNTYRRKLGEIWPELTGFLDRNQIKKFQYLECRPADLWVL